MSFCATDWTCYSEAGIFLLPCYVFLLFAFPLRYYEVKLSARCATPGKMPRLHIAKRVLVVVLACLSALIGAVYLAFVGLNSASADDN
ncbi:unnamed protein product, partial [Amoebophrya sp. A120]|eukprot:GSA120T00002869001.1